MRLFSLELSMNPTFRIELLRVVYKEIPATLGTKNLDFLSVEKLVDTWARKYFYF